MAKKVTQTLHIDIEKREFVTDAHAQSNPKTTISILISLKPNVVVRPYEAVPKKRKTPNSDLIFPESKSGQYPVSSSEPKKRGRKPVPAGSMVEAKKRSGKLKGGGTDFGGELKTKKR